MGIGQWEVTLRMASMIPSMNMVNVRFEYGMKASIYEAINKYTISNVLMTCSVVCGNARMSGVLWWLLCQ
jgi:hypothetical protein